MNADIVVHLTIAFERLFHTQIKPICILTCHVPHLAKYIDVIEILSFALRNNVWMCISEKHALLFLKMNPA